MEKDRKKKVRDRRTVAEKKGDCWLTWEDILSQSSTNAIPDSADEKSDKEIDTEYLGANNSNKYVLKSNMLDHENDMPPQYWHIRYGPHSVKPEHFETMHKLKSELHLSENQVEGAICTVANDLFGRKEYGELKQYERAEPTTYNTLSAINNTNRTEAHVEALILAGKTNEMSSEMETVVTYSNDGSAQSGVGIYVVQSFSINGKRRALPTLNIFSETGASLKDLQLMTFNILAASSGWKYTAKDLVEKIDFVTTDSTAHNLGVIQDVDADLETEIVLDSLICNMHLIMMFQRKVKQV